MCMVVGCDECAADRGESLEKRHRETLHVPSDHGSFLPLCATHAEMFSRADYKNARVGLEVPAQ